MTELPARHAKALAAARAAAAAAGLDADGLAVLRDANNTIVLLPRERLVAKVATSTLAARGDDALERELAVGRHVAVHAAPIAPPAPGGAAGPHEIDGTVVTFWEHRTSVPAPEQPDHALGRALASLHEALATVDLELPSLAARLGLAAKLLADPVATPGLSSADRRAAARAHESATSLLADAGEVIALHGEPHEGNVLWTDEGPLLIDFEAVCAGPRAWDVAHLDRTALAAFPDLEPALVDRFRLAVSFAVAAWCCAQPDGPTVVREAAAHHLGVLRERFGGTPAG
jgi:Ser/Thr protein kinase RdoA (MazF antagonist)